MGFSIGLLVPWGMQRAVGRDGKIHFLCGFRGAQIDMKRFAEATKRGL